MKRFLIWAILCLHTAIASADIVKLRVVDADDGSPLSGAMVGGTMQETNYYFYFDETTDTIVNCIEVKAEIASAEVYDFPNARQESRKARKAKQQVQQKDYWDRKSFTISATFKDWTTKDSILNAYHNLCADSCPENQKDFFDVFPSAFQEFNWFFGYKPQNVLFLIGVECVQTFGKLTAIDETTYCNRFLNLCIGAPYDTDVSGTLQGVLRKKMGFIDWGSLLYHHNNRKDKEKIAWKEEGYIPSFLETMLKVLNTRTKGEQFMFWQFYWSTLMCDTELHLYERERLRFAMKREEKSLIKPMEDAFEYFSDEVYYLHDYPLKPRVRSTAIQQE